MKLVNIPHDLRALNQWVLWHRTASGGLDKVPARVTGGNASSTDPETWGTWQEASAVVTCGNAAGVGFVFATGGGFVGIDFDGCRDKATGKMAEWAREAIITLDSYAEVSPSGTGVKVYCRGTSPFPTGRNVKLPTMPVMSPDKSPGLEVYDHGRFFAMTGERLKGMPHEPQERTEAVKLLCAKFMATEAATTATSHSEWRSEEAVIARARSYMLRVPPAIEGQGGDKHTFKAACILVLGFALQLDSAYSLMQDWNATCSPPWDDRRLRRKIDEANKQSGERGYLRNAGLDRWDAIEIPEYSDQPTAPARPNPAATGPRVTTLREAALTYLTKMETGKTQLVELGIGEVDAALGGGVEKGEMIVMAARPSHGKSAIALQCVHAWTRNGRPSLFVSEEMSAMALGKRVVQFASDVPQEYWFNRGEEVRRELTAHFDERAETIVVESCRTAEQAAEQIRKAVKDHNVETVVVDYAQLLGSGGKSRYEIVTNTSVCLRQVTTECKIVLVLLAQLNRTVETRDVFMPKNTDLKDSGQLEQDADVILHLTWPWKLDSSVKPHVYTIYVGKNRNRETTRLVLDCFWNPSRQTISAPPVEKEKSFVDWNDKESDEFI